MNPKNKIFLNAVDHSFDVFSTLVQWILDLQKPKKSPQSLNGKESQHKSPPFKNASGLQTSKNGHPSPLDPCLGRLSVWIYVISVIWIHRKCCWRQRWKREETVEVRLWKYRFCGILNTLKIGGFRIQFEHISWDGLVENHQLDPVIVMIYEVL